MPLPQQLASGTPRRLKVERTEVTEHRRTRHDVREERSITMYGTCRRDWHWMVGGGCTRPRPPVLSPWGTGDRQPSDPSRSTRPCVPPDAGNRSPKTLRRRTQSKFRISLPLPQQSATMTPQRLPHVASCKKNRTLLYSSGDTHGWHWRLHVVRTSPRPTLTMTTSLVNSIREGATESSLPVPKGSLLDHRALMPQDQNGQDPTTRSVSHNTQNKVP